MKTNAGGVRTLALAALLALLGGAGAGADDWSSDECGSDTAPKITANVEIKDDWYVTTYGEDIVLHCSAKNVTNLEIKDYYDNFLQSIEVNTTTIQFIVKKPKVDVHEYSCADSETGCGTYLTVSVKPAMSVQSLSQYQQVNYKGVYWVQLGEDYEVSCSGHDSADLTIESDVDDELLQTDVVNSTLIKYATQANRVKFVVYSCSNQREDTDLIVVGVYYYPECHNFRCFIYKFNLECSWNYSSDFKFELHYVHLSEGYELLCSDYSGKATGACRVDTRFVEHMLHNSDITLLLITCNMLFCNNQTFTMNSRAITKLDAKFYRFRVLNTAVDGVSLQWKYCNSKDLYDNLTWKVEYRQTAFDDDWRQTDSSSTRCYGDKCGYDLTLPYPDAEYKVRLSTRHKEATDDRLWSKPRSLRVTTARVEVCACSAAPDAPAEPTTTVSAETVLCKLCKLREDMIKESLALKHKIKSSLKKKHADLKRISELSNTVIPASMELNKILDQYG